MAKAKALDVVKVGPRSIRVEAIAMVEVIKGDLTAAAVNVHFIGGGHEHFNEAEEYRDLVERFGLKDELKA